MAEVVFIEPDEELGSLVQKLEQAGQEDLVLLVPKGASLLEDPLHWNLVQRQARSLGRRVVVVTRSRRVRQSARRAGFAVYRSLRRLKFRLGRDQAAPLTPLLRKGRGSGVPVVLASGVLGSLLFVALGAYLLVPTGTITLKPSAQEIALTISVRASEQLKEPDVAENGIPARLIYAPLEGIETADSTGHKAVPGKARGEVTFLNRGPARQSVPTFTVVAAGQGAQFTTLEQVSLPPSGGTARARIIAVNPGPGGNVGSMAVDRVVDESLAAFLAVWNELPTSGGLEEDLPLVTAQDQVNLRTRLRGKLVKEGQERLQALRGESESIYPSTISFEPVDEVFDKRSGDESSTLTLRVKGGVSGLAFDGQYVNLLAQKALEGRVLQGFRLLPRTLDVSPLEAFDWGEGWVAFRVLVKAKASIVVEPDQVVESLQGKNPREAQEYLNWRFPQRDQLNLQVKPIWMDWVPIYLWKVEVRY